MISQRCKTKFLLLFADDILHPSESHMELALGQVALSYGYVEYL